MQCCIHVYYEVFLPNLGFQAATFAEPEIWRFQAATFEEPEIRGLTGDTSEKVFNKSFTT